MPADRQLLPSIKHLLLREEDDNDHSWSAAQHQHVITDYQSIDNDKAFGPPGFHKPISELHQPIYHPHFQRSPGLELQPSPTSTPTSSPPSWSPPHSNDDRKLVHKNASQHNMRGSTRIDHPPQVAPKKHCRSFSEASQLQDLNAYHRRFSDGDRPNPSTNTPNSSSTKSAFKDTRKHSIEEDVSENSTTPPHENGIIVFGTKAVQTSAQQTPSGHRYVCQHCSKTFARPSSLRVHSYSHTGEKPYACPDASCGRRFSVCSNLRRHMRVHRLRHDPPQWKPKASIDSSSTGRATSI
ncbi:hypothetical protein INT43_003704 [Umbelopsis isabellina]|uniref:C2H2-type domain-containing protein n=1 Tax=Mortierella isabellina TaxID=91625 RepID=A0A8H7UFN6_MORIS|nr:hypothetical protein INT43_003704 [Umbelopsis isabellina]